ncbi:MAG TPA: amidohydrolase family protein [Candidatus Thermoplasmatota archaeon]|jgi:hypothetical protein|nr:amidohydrolase family protein [Candidatus Thermoplasmatota archaeon]
MLVDCHVHLNNYKPRPVPVEESLQQLLVRMRKYRIDHALVLSSYVVNQDRLRADQLLDLVAAHPELSVVEGVTFEDGRPAGLEGIRARLEAGRTVGLKMYPGYLPFYPEDPVCEPVYDLAMEFGVPVMFHAGDTYARGAKVKYSHPLHLDDVAVDHPDMALIVCHLGNPWFRDAAEVIYKNENVYADISGLVLEGFEANLERWLVEEVRDIITYAGDPKFLLYGTDWPLVRMGPYLNFVRGLGLPEKDLERMLWRNANDLFGLGLSPGRPPRRKPGRRAPGGKPRPRPRTRRRRR